MPVNNISFSRDFKQQYRNMNKFEKDSVDDVLRPLGPVLKSMSTNDLHFRKILLRFNVKGPQSVLYVFIHDNPIRAVVKIAGK